MDDDKKRVKAGDVRNLTRVHPEHDPRAFAGVRRVPSGAPAPDQPHEVGTVAAGRSVDIVVEGDRVQCGFDKDAGVPVYRCAQRRALPGERVELPRSEIARLRGLGFLVDPSAAPVPTDKGRRSSTN